MALSVSYSLTHLIIHISKKKKKKQIIVPITDLNKLGSWYNRRALN